MGQMGQDVGKVIGSSDPSENTMQQNLVRGSLRGLGKGLQNQPQTQMGGGGVPINIPQAPQIDPSYFQGTPGYQNIGSVPYQQSALGFQRGPRPNSMFFGG